MKKYIITIIAILCLSFIIAAITFESNAVGLNEVFKNPDDYIDDSGDNSGAIAIGNVIVWIVRTVGESIAVIMLMIIGIRYIIASAEEKAEYKQSMWPYILGAILIFAGSALTDLIYNAFNK